MTPLRSWGRRGARLIEPVPHGHWKTTTFLCGLRRQGLVAPLVIDGAVNGDLFRAWTEQHLARELRPGDIVIMDTLNSHKVEGVETAIRKAGVGVRYLPADSPDLNPIEMAFSKLKHHRRAARQTKVDALWHKIGELLGTVTPEECQNDIRHAGYKEK